MKNRYFPTIFLMLFFSTGLYAQSPTPLPADDVVKITTRLVQLDAVVTDNGGKQVTDLKETDFEVLQDGKPQKITGFSYINTETGAVLRSGETKKPLKNAILPPPATVRPGNTGRIITFIVDDGNCTASVFGMMAAKEGLEKFVREQMLPNDQVAIYRTRAGSSMLQQYVSDKAQLMRSVEKIRWYPAMGSCSTNDGSMFEAAKSNTYTKYSAGGTKENTIESENERKSRESSEDLNRNNQVVGTIGVINYVVHGLERVGGRKVVFLMSDGLPLRARDGQALSSVDVLRDLSELANRASVVFHTIDVRGLFSTSNIEARDEVSTLGDPNATDKLVGKRQTEVMNTQDGLFFLADSTGGRFYNGVNDLDSPVRKALGLEKGYYLLAYEPADETFKGKNFNKIEIRLKRPDLKIRSRSGFYGVVDQAAKTSKRTAYSDLYAAIAAPIPQPGLNVQLTAFFVNSPEAGNFVRSWFHLDGNEITFVDDANGQKKAVFDVVAVTLDEKNRVVDEFTRSHTFRVEAAAIPYINKNGLVYSTDVPIKSAGTYNFRVAVRDVSSKMIGSSTQIVQIPDLKKAGLFVSGLTLSQAEANGSFSVPTSVKPDLAFSLTASPAIPAVRRFRRGANLSYSFTIYNARIDPAAGRPRLSVQMNLYRDGQMVSEGSPRIAAHEMQTDWSRINDFDYLRLTREIVPGDYAIQIIIRDQSASGKNAISSQWIDFEVVD